MEQRHERVLATKKETCYGCPDRCVSIHDGKAVSCHSTCPDWAERKAKHDKEQEEYRKASKIEGDIRDYQVRAIEKARRKHR